MPMEKPSSGVMAAMAVLVTEPDPPKKICGTLCFAVIRTAVQGGFLVGTCR